MLGIRGWASVLGSQGGGNHLNVTNKALGFASLPSGLSECSQALLAILRRRTELSVLHTQGSCQNSPARLFVFVFCYSPRRPEGCPPPGTGSQPREQDGHTNLIPESTRPSAGSQWLPSVMMAQRGPIVYGSCWCFLWRPCLSCCSLSLPSHRPLPLGGPHPRPALSRPFFLALVLLWPHPLTSLLMLIMCNPVLSHLP